MIRSLNGRWMSHREARFVARQLGLVPPPAPVDVLADRRKAPTPHLELDCPICIREEAIYNRPSLGERIGGWARKALEWIA
jgi:hypothetical protein